MLVLEPIFEADFEESSYGFRPKRSAADALKAVAEHLRSGRTDVYDADLKAYFDTIPHDKLMSCLRKRIADGSVLSLIRMWLDAPVEDTDENGRRTRDGTRRGVPQGGMISPLLANLYLHWLDKLFMAAGGPGKFAGARIVRYADDFVVLGEDARAAREYRRRDPELPRLLLPLGGVAPGQRTALPVHQALRQVGAPLLRTASGSHVAKAVVASC